MKHLDNIFVCKCPKMEDYSLLKFRGRRQVMSRQKNISFSHLCTPVDVGIETQRGEAMLCETKIHIFFCFTISKSVFEWIL